jgi:hypothetical protein
MLIASLVGLCAVPRQLVGQTSPKKGIGEYGQPFAARTLVDWRVAWYYDWRPVSDVLDPPRNIQFIPMIRGRNNLNAADELAAKNSGAGILLAFNEPDGQSNMTVEEALAARPQLEALHMVLGSTR